MKKLADNVIFLIETPSAPNIISHFERTTFEKSEKKLILNFF